MEPDASDRMTAYRDPFVGAVLDRRYEVVERIAEGGFGAVYRARHVRNALEVAIKILHPKLAGDPRVVARFRREGAALTALRSPHTVTTYELVEDGPTLFIVMELLRGQTVRQKFQADGPMPWSRVVDIGRAVCESLAEAHGLGIVHRDLKPANIFVGDDGVVKVLDFGIAKLLLGSRIGDSAEDLTNVNEVVGTIDYVSPEQVAGDSYTGRSDIYTLGVVMYELLTGERPFAPASGAALLAMVVTSTPPPPSERMPGLPISVDTVVLRCLARDPAARFADANELADALELVQEREESVTRATALPPPAPLADHADNEPTSIMAERPRVELEPEPDAASEPTEPAATIQPTLEGGWVAPAPFPARMSAPSMAPVPPFPALPPTPMPVPLHSAGGIPTYVWIIVLLAAIGFGVLLATI